LTNGWQDKSASRCFQFIAHAFEGEAAGVLPRLAFPVRRRALVVG